MPQHIWSRSTRSDMDGQKRKLQKNKNVAAGEFNKINSPQTVDKTLLVSTPEAFFLFSVQKVCT